MAWDWVEMSGARFGARNIASARLSATSERPRHLGGSGHGAGNGLGGIGGSTDQPQPDPSEDQRQPALDARPVALHIAQRTVSNM